MLRHRLATAAVAIPTLLVLIFRAPPWGFALLAVVVAILGVAEYNRMVFPDRPGDRFVFLTLGVFVAVATTTHHRDAFAASIAVLVVGGFLWVLLGRRDFEAGLADLGRGLVGVLYAGYLLPHFAWLHGLVDGPYWVVLVIFTTMMCDTGGYFAGRAFGRHKLSPRISPAKTVEGAVGTTVAALVAGAVAKLIILPRLSWAEALLVAVGIAILAQLGDLCESMIKRTYGAKDSGRLLPGHGGVLDRIDSLVFPVVGMYYYVCCCR